SSGLLAVDSRRTYAEPTGHGSLERRTDACGNHTVDGSRFVPVERQGEARCGGPPPGGRAPGRVRSAVERGLDVVRFRDQRRRLRGAGLLSCLRADLLAASPPGGARVR